MKAKTVSKRYNKSQLAAIKDFLERRRDSAGVAVMAAGCFEGTDLEFWQENTKRYYRLVQSICRWMLATLTRTPAKQNAKNKHERDDQTRLTK